MGAQFSKSRREYDPFKGSFSSAPAHSDPYGLSPGLELVDSQAEVIPRSHHSIRARSPPRRHARDVVANDERGKRMEEDFTWVGSFASRNEYEPPASPKIVPSSPPRESAAPELADQINVAEGQVSIPLWPSLPAPSRLKHQEIGGNAVVDMEVKKSRRLGVVDISQIGIQDEQFQVNEVLVHDSKSNRRLLCCF